MQLNAWLFVLIGQFSSLPVRCIIVLFCTYNLEILTLVFFCRLTRLNVRTVSQSTVDPAEVRKFQAMASKWWDLQGEFAALHSMNDLRVPFIRYVHTTNKRSMTAL